MSTSPPSRRYPGFSSGENMVKFRGKSTGRISRYAYITARVRVMKSRLIPKDMYPKFLNMEIPEITRFIEESDYKKDVDELARKYSGVDLVEHALNENLALTYRKLIEISQDEANFFITEYLRQWDIWNIKTILRGKYYGASEEEILEAVVSAGQLRYRDLTQIVKIATVEGVVAALSETPYFPAIQDYKGGPLADLENNLDKLYYLRLLRSIGDSPGEKLFLKFLRTEIDVKNLKTLFRTKKAGMEREDIIRLLILGGMELKENDLLRLAALPYQEFVRSLEEYSYWNAISSQIEEPSLLNIEIGLDRFGLEYASKISYYYPLSILPVLDYILGKKNEVDNIRIIVRGKETRLPEEIIKSHLVM
jgi:V/A-type H+-transporting ATPase subunit C